MHTPKTTRPAALSLKTRFALAVGVLILVTAGLLTTASMLVIQRGIENVIGDRQSTLIQQVAAELDDKFKLRTTALTRLALDFGGASGAQPQRLQAMLEQHHSLDALFDNFAIFGLDGEQIANLDRPDSRGKLNVAKRDYFKQTLLTRAPVISQPIRSQISGRPLVLMTAPILDSQNRITAVLAGTIDLARGSFTKDVSVSRIGKSGYFYILTKDGVFVSHPDETRLLKNSRELAGRSPSIDLALGGLEGTVRSFTRDGVEALVSFKHLASTDWIVAAVYPVDEAFAPVRQVRLNAILIVIVLMLVIAPVAWLVIDHQLVPLQQLRDRMLRARDDRSPIVVPLVHKFDEIGDLARAFDALMRERERVERSLAESEKNLRMIADNLPALVGYVDRTEHFVFGNHRYQAVFGISAATIPGRSVLEVIGAEVYAVSQPYVRAALNGNAVRFERQVMRHGIQQWDRVAYIPDINPSGEVDGFFLLVEDITELKATQQIMASSEKRIRTITDNMPALIGYIDTEQRYRFCNSYKMNPGMNPEDIIGHTVGEVFGTEFHTEIAPHIAAALAGKTVSFERHAHEFGASKYLQYEFIPDLGSETGVMGIYTMVTDISQRKEAELTVASRERLLRAVTDNLPALVSFIDLEGRFQFANRPHEIWFNRPLAQIRGHLISTMLGAELNVLHQQHFAQAVLGQTVEYAFETMRSGGLRHYHATYVPQFDEQADIMGISCLVNDITDAKLVEQQLSALARFDTLTGLPNRSQLNDRINDAVERSVRNQRSIAVMYLDVDNFKAINDSLGHHGGDAVLKQFALRLSACVRLTDTVGRMAGDEFVIVLEGLQHDAESTLVAQKIVRAMERPFDIDGSLRVVTASIGIAVSHGKKVSAESILKKADEALYRAKKAGRNTYSCLAM